MENYIEDIKDLLFEYAPSVITALVILFHPYDEKQ